MGVERERAGLTLGVRVRGGEGCLLWQLEAETTLNSQNFMYVISTEPRFLLRTRAVNVSEGAVNSRRETRNRLSLSVCPSNRSWPGRVPLCTCTLLSAALCMLFLVRAPPPPAPTFTRLVPNQPPGLGFLCLAGRPTGNSKTRFKF